MTSIEVQQFMNAGFSFIPVGVDKRPWIDSWTQYQYRRPDPEEVSDMPFLEAPNVAIIAGDVSGGVECIDFDTKNDPTGQIWQQFKDAVDEKKIKDILLKTTIQQTSSGGYHIIYKCDKVGRNEKLALPEKSNKPIIETRGNGGYFLVHPSQRYDLKHGTIVGMNRITIAERDTLINLCRSLNRQQEQKPQTRIATIANKENTTLVNTMEKICGQIEKAKIDITQGYDTWVKIGCGMAHSLREEGRSFFHRVSQFHPEYNVNTTNEKYDHFLKTHYKNRHATIKSFFGVASEYGVDVSDDKDQDIDPIQKWVQAQAFAFNVVTRKILDRYGDPLDDVMINTLYRRCKSELGLKFGIGEFNTYLFNYDNINAFNPIMDFFEPLRFRHFEGTPVEDYIDHLELKDDRWKPIIRKWMLSVVAQAYGFNSEMVLVLVGLPNVGKTQFFLRMFPPAFGKEYCVVNDLKEGKDSQILMTQKLVIVDDEFGGLNQKDTQHFKALVSQEQFSIRMPYGRVIQDVRKLCVMAGATNKNQVINDYTGNRRIIPVEVLSRDFQKADAVDRYDMWAELVQEYWGQDMSEEWTVSKEDVQFIMTESERYQQVNAPMEYITKYFEPPENGHADFMTATEICEFINEKHPSARLYSNQVGQQLAHLGFERISKRRGKFPVYGYLVVETDEGKKAQKEPLPF